jgi:hypothetical protein
MVIASEIIVNSTIVLSVLDAIFLVDRILIFLYLLSSKELHDFYSHGNVLLKSFVRE